MTTARHRSNVIDDPQALANLLHVHDASCPVCGYSLLGLTGPICPECGAALDIRIGSTDLRLGRWLGSVIAWALPLGFLANVGAWGVVQAIRTSPPRGVAPVLTYTWTAAALSAAMFIIVIWERRRVLCWSRRRQSLLVLISVVGSMGLTLGFFVMFLLFN